MQPRFSPAMTDNKRRRGNRGGKRKRQRQAAGPFGQNQAPGTVTPFLQGNGKNIEKQFLPFVLVLAWDIQDSQTCHLSRFDCWKICFHISAHIYQNNKPAFVSRPINWNLELLLFGRLVPCFMRKAPITAFRVERRPSSEAEAKMLSGVRPWVAECSKCGWWRCYMMGCHCQGAIAVCHVGVPFVGRHGWGKTTFYLDV